MSRFNDHLQRYQINARVRQKACRFPVGFQVIDAPVATRPDDQLGFAVASARVGDPYRTYVNQIGGNAQRRETNWELTYRAQLSERLAIQPDIQFVQYPAASSSLDNAWVVALRFEIAY